jgi:TamB, inner membrane protein subunit of TAM complex
MLGNISQIDATITATPETGWQLGVNGLLGNPFTITGSLTPLDVRLQGQDLNLRAPRNFLASSDSNADIRVRYENGIVISGAVDASRVNLDLNREATTAGATQVPPSETTAPAPQAASQQQNRFLEQIRFENIAIRAPQQITFKENFGEAELGIDVVLSGTAAQPELSGEAQSKRGTFRFAGRDFTIDKATAVFQPSQGIYPTIEVLAYSTFEKSQALLGLQNVELVEPSGRTFRVFLNLKTDLVEREGGGFAATDPATTLSSNAKLEQASSAATAGGQRLLTQDELYSLLTLGRLQLASTITGQGSVAESVAQGAIDTTIELFILSELQKQIGTALGVQLFELRTTTLSSLLGGSQQFGVSLRIGGYLDDALFASYEIRTLDLEPDIAFANEFDLRYEFDRLEVDLTGRLNFRATSFTPVPELSVGLGYAITPLVRLETNVDLAQARQGIGFGVSLRW